MTYSNTTVDFTKNAIEIDAKFDELIADIRALQEFESETDRLQAARIKAVNDIIDARHAAGKSHGFSTSDDPERRSLYNCFHNINLRCRNPFHPKYRDYGGRGIENRFPDFLAFARCVGLRPSDKHSIDRIDNDGHYEPGNVRWANIIEQNANRRPRRKAKK